MYSPKKGAEVITAVRPEFEKIVKALAGGNMKFIWRVLFANPDLRELRGCLSKVSRTICEACSLLCKKNAQPVTLFLHNDMSLEQAESFSWTQAILEPSTRVPTLFKIIHNSVVTRSLVRNKHKRDAQYPGLCTAVANLLTEHKREMCGVQSYKSSALFSTKGVCVCVYVCV